MAQLLLQPPGPALNQEAAHKTFAEFYGDEALDPCAGNYEDLMNRFDLDVNPGATPLNLFEQATAAGPIPQAYLCCTQRQGHTIIQCLHLPSKITGSFTGRATPWDGQGFAFLGEITQTYATTVSLPNNAFRAIMNTKVRTADYIVTHLDELGPHGLPPPPAGDEEGIIVNTRQLMCLPARYVPLILNPAGYTLRQVWETLYPAIVDNDHLQTCAPLIRWLQVASTGTTVPNQPNNLTASRLDLTLTAPIADDVLIKHRLLLLKQVLPILFRPANPYEAAITQMAVAVTENTNHSRLAREQKAATAAAPKLPSDKFGLTLPLLLEYLEIPEEQNLPELWHQLANCTKRQEFFVLSDQIQVYSRSPHAFNTSIPVVFAKLVQDILSFQFVSKTLDDLKTGLQPFVIASGSTEHRQANLEVARMYGLLNTGEQSIMLADLEQLKAKEVQSIPLSYYELERNLGMFGNLLGAVLGTTHRLTVAYKAFWDLLTVTFCDQIHQIIDEKCFIKPAHILRSVQLECFAFFSTRRMRQRPPDPNFCATLWSLIRDTYVVPHLPFSLYRLAYNKTTPTPPSNATNSNNTSPTPSLATITTGSASSSSSGNASVVSGLTAATARTKQGQGSFIANLSPDRDLQILVDYGTKIQELISRDPPPLLNDGTPICLAYYVRTGCWTNCKRANSHGRQLTSDEKTRITAYIQAQTQKLRTRYSSSSVAGSASNASQG